MTTFDTKGTCELWPCACVIIHRVWNRNTVLCKGRPHIWIKNVTSEVQSNTWGHKERWNNTCVFIWALFFFTSALLFFMIYTSCIFTSQYLLVTAWTSNQISPFFWVGGLEVILNHFPAFLHNITSLMKSGSRSVRLRMLWKPTREYNVRRISVAC